MDDAGWLMELRLIFVEFRGFVADLGLNKWEVLAVFCFVVLMIRLPAILTHRREIAAIQADFALKGSKLEARIEDQRAKRRSKASKGKR